MQSPARVAISPTSTCSRSSTLVRERVRRLDEVFPLAEFFFSGDIDFAPLAKDLVPKGRTVKDTAT